MGTKIVAVHQPNYLPHLGFFRKIDQADIFVIYDTAQYTKNSFINRNRIRTKDGWMWLTVPVKKEGVLIIEKEVDNTHNWRAKHWKAISANYNRAKYFNEYCSFFEDAYSKEWRKLAKLNEFLIKYLLQELDIHVKVVKASELDLKEQDPTEKLIEMTKKVKGDVYLSGTGGKSYLDEKLFTDIKLSYFKKFESKPYKQVFGGFVNNLSVIDYLFNCGKPASGKVI